MRVLGIGYFVAHDANVALVSDGKVEFACSEERLTRRKRDGSFPQRAIDHVRSFYPTAEHIVASYNDDAKYKEAHLGITDSVRITRFAGLQRQHEVALRSAGTTAFLGHHFCHAAGGLFTSGFRDAIVITYDGGIVCEPWLATLWEARDNTLKPIRSLTRLDGATAAIRYSAVTSLLGFRPVHDEGKITGLAACGSVNDYCIGELVAAFEKQPEPSTYYNGKFSQDFATIRERYSTADIAASIQAMTEETVLELLAQHVSNPTATNLVMAGGLFANVLLNFRIKKMGFKKIYVYPAMGDEGLSAGAALAHAVKLGHSPSKLDHLYLGPEYSASDISNALTSYGLQHTRYEKVESEIALLLAEGKVVGRFNGPMEFGPRALGNRSILYRADDPSVNSWLNAKLGRTETMPFAPVTLSSFAEDMYSELDGLERCTPFMTTVVPCKDKMRRQSPAVVHVDGTARPQLVSSDTNASLHAVLSEYFALTGTPTLINTSFNLHGEPIVCSPEDAIRCFLNGGLDYLAIGECLVKNPSISRRERLDVKARQLL